MTAPPTMEPIHPGEILQLEYTEPLGITRHRVAVAIGVAPRRLNEIVHGKRGITADTALRLRVRPGHARTSILPSASRAREANVSSARAGTPATGADAASAANRIGARFVDHRDEITGERLAVGHLRSTTGKSVAARSSTRTRSAGSGGAISNAGTRGGTASRDHRSCRLANPGRVQA